MSEISREIVINKINEVLSSDTRYDETLTYQLTSLDFDWLEKALSDMEKLEKIEALYEPKPFGQGLSRENRDRQIEQIVKG